jgi:serine/threonine-protein kinase
MVVIAKHLHDDPRDPRSFQPALSEALCAVILRMMARSRDDRYPDMASVDLELARLQNGEAPEQATLAGLETTVVAGGVDPAGSTLAVDPRFNPDELARVETHLAEAIGPLAKVLVKRASAMTSDLGELCQAVARHIPSSPVRERFLSQILDPGATAQPPSAATQAGAASRSAPSQAAQSPAAAASSGAVEWDPQSLRALEKRLAASIGPVARVMVSKTARRAASWSSLVGTLAENLSDPTERAAFQREFEQQ